jgi:hypothetical protein
MDQEITAKDVIREKANEAAERQIPLSHCTHYLANPSARVTFEIYYWERMMELNGELTA